MPEEAREVRSAVVVEAPAAFVREHLAEVATLQGAGYRPRPFQWLGVPGRFAPPSTRPRSLAVGELEHDLR